MIKKEITFTKNGIPSIWDGVNSFNESILVLDRQFEIKKPTFTNIEKGVRKRLIIIREGDIIVEVTEFSTNIYRIEKINKNNETMILEKLNFEKDGEVLSRYRTPISIAQSNLRQILSRNRRISKHQKNKKNHKNQRKVG